MLDVETTFCYLGGMPFSSGGCDSAIAARCCVAWGKLRKLLPVLNIRHLSPRICSKVYEACVHSMVAKHGVQIATNCSGSAAMTLPWSVGSVAWKWNILTFTTTETWHQGYHIGHSLSTPHVVWSCTTGHVLYQIYHKLSDPSIKRKVRPWKTCSEWGKTEVNGCGPTDVDPLGRDAWKASVWHSLVLPNPYIGTTIAP